MIGAGLATEQPVSRREQIANAIETLLKTPQGSVIAQRATGVNYLNAEGCPHAELGPASVEASAHQALLRDEPRIELDAVTAHFDGDALINIRVAYRDREDASQHEVTVIYRE
jgi:phage baseplate assembly protein W